jgi:HK97 gp10 family phage protein
MAKTFSADASAIPRITTNVMKYVDRERKLLNQKITVVTNQLYLTARAKRPMITAKQAKAEGRNKRVSDPNAEAGVPVDTGALQISIEKKVVDNGKQIYGTVYVNPNIANSKSGKTVAQYATAIEYGTSKMPARSFMRASLNVNRAYIQKVLRQQEK